MTDISSTVGTVGTVSGSAGQVRSDAEELGSARPGAQHRQPPLSMPCHRAIFITAV